MVGTAYLAPEPGAKPFVSIGSKIKRGYSFNYRSNEDNESYFFTTRWDN